MSLVSGWCSQHGRPNRLMKPTVAPPTPTCREFLGLDGWCPTAAAPGDSFCEWHSKARQRYDEQTRRRTGAL